ncbi:MAG: hypothetical protein FD163_110 [Hyphomonadaceae bacterium]|nr:MAG: hypothetical protein FD128_1575 [Hyphomonadaceae bacterium]KAF0186835.1 MAG: hypothetical protein FD163_110 [Hyphomonadaceae bacterium]
MPEFENGEFIKIYLAKPNKDLVNPIVMTIVDGTESASYVA